jgi:hypothetical protein
MSTDNSNAIAAGDAAQALAEFFNELLSRAIRLLGEERLLLDSNESIQIPDLIVFVNERQPANKRNHRTELALLILEYLNRYHRIVTGGGRIGAEDVAGLSLCSAMLGALFVLSEDGGRQIEDEARATLLGKIRGQKLREKNAHEGRWHQRALSIIADLLASNPHLKKDSLDTEVAALINKEFGHGTATPGAVEKVRLRKGKADSQAP